MTTVEIITIGTEIITGQIVNTNASYIAKVLNERGFCVLFQTSVRDEKDYLKTALKIALDRVRLIIVTGGLGPTENDITRKVISEFLGLPLVSNKEAYACLQEHFKNIHVSMPDSYKNQFLIPEGSDIIINDSGTASGFISRYNDKEIVCLPGVPGEMQLMLNKYLKVRELCCKVLGGYIVTKDLHTFGVPEIVAEDIAKKCMQGNNGHVAVMTLVHDGIVTINIQVNEKTKEGALGLLNRVESGIRNELGGAVFGTCNETLEDAVAELLRRYKKTIAVAESCTGGLVSDRLTNVSGISEFFLEGIVAYSNKSKVDLLGVPEELILRHGAVSPQVASAMAIGVRKRSSADIGVGITGIAGPTGATKEKPVGLVYIAVDANQVTEVKECRFKGSRIDIKKYSTNTALNMVRLKLMEAN